MQTERYHLAGFAVIGLPFRLNTREKGLRRQWQITGNYGNLRAAVHYCQKRSIGLSQLERSLDGIPGSTAESCSVNVVGTVPGSVFKRTGRRPYTGKPKEGDNAHISVNVSVRATICVLEVSSFLRQNFLTWSLHDFPDRNPPKHYRYLRLNIFLPALPDFHI